MTQKQIGDCVFFVMGAVAGSLVFVEQPRHGIPAGFWLALGVVALAAFLIYADDGF